MSAIVSEMLSEAYEKHHMYRSIVRKLQESIDDLDMEVR